MTGLTVKSLPSSSIPESDGVPESNKTAKNNCVKQEPLEILAVFLTNLPDKPVFDITEDSYNNLNALRSS